MSAPLVMSHILLWVVVVLLAVVTLAAVRQIGLIHKRLPPVGARMTPVGPELGSKAPEFDTRDLFGRRAALSDAGPKKVLLLFISTRCVTCNEIAPAIKSIARSEAPSIDTLILSDNPEDDVRDFVTRHRIDHLPIVVSRELVEAFGVQTTPYGIVVDESRNVVTKGIVNNIEHLESLVRAGELGVDSLETYSERLDGRVLETDGAVGLNGGQG